MTSVFARRVARASPTAGRRHGRARSAQGASARWEIRTRGASSRFRGSNRGLRARVSGTSRPDHRTNSGGNQRGAHHGSCRSCGRGDRNVLSTEEGHITAHRRRRHHFSRLRQWGRAGPQRVGFPGGSLTSSRSPLPRRADGLLRKTSCNFRTPGPDTAKLMFEA